MLVIARNSTFIYKGKAVDVKQVGRDQGVRYVLEGGVRKAGSRVRITAQLIDASTGQHRWADRYDRNLEDIFAVQDEITKKIVSELDVQLRAGEQARLFSSGTDNLEAWECVRLGSDLVNSVKGDQIPEAMRLLKRAIDLDPEYASAWNCLAWSHFHIAEDYESIYSEEERKQALESTVDCAHQALEFDPSSADAYAVLGLYHLTLSDHEAAIENINKSVQLAPNHAINIAISAAILNKCGQPEKAIERIRKAMRLSPIYPLWNLSLLGQAYRLAGMIDVAIETYNEYINIEADSLEAQIALAEIFGATNQLEQAAVSAKEVLRLNPEFTINKYVDDLAYSDPAVNLRFADGLRKAGLPE
jgi:adenylate cyclase